MTEQNTQSKNESASAKGDRDQSQSQQDSEVKDSQPANQPEGKGGLFQQYCDANPGSPECRVYDV
jgi:hypothetical protein